MWCLEYFWVRLPLNFWDLVKDASSLHFQYFWTNSEIQKKERGNSIRMLFLIQFESLFMLLLKIAAGTGCQEAADRLRLGKMLTAIKTAEEAEEPLKSLRLSRVCILSRICLKKCWTCTTRRTMRRLPSIHKARVSPPSSLVCQMQKQRFKARKLSNSFHQFEQKTKLVLHQIKRHRLADLVSSRLQTSTSREKTSRATSTRHLRKGWCQTVYVSLCLQYRESMYINVVSPKNCDEPLASDHLYAILCLLESF